MIKVHKSKNNVTVTEIKNAEKYLFYQITFCFTLARKRSVGLPFFFFVHLHYLQHYALFYEN